ncbi:hypothetical protein Tco_0413663 [Tanacetum coccineum]
MRRKDLSIQRSKDSLLNSIGLKLITTTSSTDKSMNEEETVHDAAMEADQAMDADEDEVANVEEYPQDDATSKQDKSTWFKQPPRPETPNPEWHKDLTVNDGPEQRNKERKYVASVAKIKAARYDLKYIEDMIPKSRNAATSPHEVFSRFHIPSVIRLTIDNQFGYGYLKEIVVRRGDLKEYSFREADFSRLRLKDIKDLFLLYVQHKIHNLMGYEIVHLVYFLRIFTRSIVIQRRVEDVQLGVESYQEKLHITRPQTLCDGISFKKPYTIFDEPRGVVYLNKSKRKRLIRADELYKFSDSTLKMVHDELNDMLHNFVLGYNHAIPTRAWSEKDQQGTDEMLKLIDNMLLERRIMRSLECYVSGSTNETDYRLHMRKSDFVILSY